MSIIKLSKQIADPRVAGRTVHKMEHILVRIIVKAYAAGLKCGSKEGEQHQLHMPTLHGMLLNIGKMRHD